jgi:hypothetical protein
MASNKGSPTVAAGDSESTPDELQNSKQASLGGPGGLTDADCKYAQWFE